MSRHRNVRRLDDDDYYDDDDDDDEDEAAYGTPQSPSVSQFLVSHRGRDGAAAAAAVGATRAQPQQTRKPPPPPPPPPQPRGKAAASTTVDDARVAAAASKLMDVLGDDGFTRAQMRAACRKLDCDVDAAADYLLGCEPAGACRPDLAARLTRLRCAELGELVAEYGDSAGEAQRAGAAIPSATAPPARQASGTRAAVKPSSLALGLVDDDAGGTYDGSPTDAGDDDALQDFEDDDVRPRAAARGRRAGQLEAAMADLRIGNQDFAVKGDLHRYNFDDPSPDDIANERRSALARRGAGNNDVIPPAPPRPGGSHTQAQAQAQAQAQQHQRAARGAVPPRSSTSTFSLGSAAGAGAGIATHVSSPSSQSSTSAAAPVAVVRVPQARDRNAKAAAAMAAAAGERTVHLSLVVIGHVDAGKSTLMGHLLFKLGQVSSQQMHKNERESQAIGKASFKFAWVLDSSAEERSRGVTIDVSERYFKTNNRQFTLLDAPGHRDFIPNMISGTSQADCAVLVVDATPSGFESGMSQDGQSTGQTREHALLAKSLGVHEIVVAVNKMDLCGWSEARFKVVCDEIGKYLDSIGFKRAQYSFVPVAGLAGENLVTRRQDEMAWYSGPTLVEALDKLSAPARNVDAPFRLCVVDTLRARGATISVKGRVSSGAVCTGDNVAIVPGGQELAQVKCTRRCARLDAADVPADRVVRDATDVSRNGDPMAGWAKAGDYAEVGLVSATDDTLLSIVRVGVTLCDPMQPAIAVSQVRARVLTFGLSVPLLPGAKVVLHAQGADEEAEVVKLHALLDRATMQVVKNRIRSVPAFAAADISVRLARSLVLETAQQSRALSRFTLRDGGHTVAAGVVDTIEAVATAASLAQGSGAAGAR